LVPDFGEGGRSIGDWLWGNQVQVTFPFIAVFVFCTPFFAWRSW
jgi:hypothetical protein